MVLALITVYQPFIQASAADTKLTRSDGLIFNREERYDVSATGGVFLPYGIPGMTETYQGWSFGFSHPSSITQMEYSLHSLIGHGVTRYSLAWTLRIDFSFSDVFAGYIGLGPVFNFTKLDDGPFGRSGGFHLAFGNFLPITSNFSFRSDIKYGNASGRSLFVGVGLLYAFGGKSAGGPTPP